MVRKSSQRTKRRTGLLAPHPITRLPAEIMGIICAAATAHTGPTREEYEKRRKTLLCIALFHRSWTKAAKGEAMKARVLDLGASHERSKTVKELNNIIVGMNERACELDSNVRDLLVTGDGGMPRRSARTLHSTFARLDKLVTDASGAARELLFGSRNLGELVLRRTSYPRLGLFPGLTRLVIVECQGDGLAATLTDANFPSLHSIVFDLLPPSVNTSEVGYSVAGTTPPRELIAVALKGFGYFDLFAPLLASSRRLKFLHLELPAYDTAAIFDYVASDLTYLSLRRDTLDRDSSAYPTQLARPSHGAPRLDLQHHPRLQQVLMAIVAPGETDPKDSVYRMFDKADQDCVSIISNDKIACRSRVSKRR
ncbi:hypothetical protein JCM10449v2_003857 [Rhodotorula kratochvilovae]